MAARFLLIVIDDERPLGPQLKAVRNFAGLPWKLLASLCGGLSVRHLQNLAASAHFCERQTVRRGINVPPLTASDEGGDQMAGLFGGAPQQQYVPMPTVPAPDDSAAREAARKERLADSLAVGRSSTILTDYAIASQTPPTLKKTLGGE